VVFVFYVFYANWAGSSISHCINLCTLNLPWILLE
jgi:hypothetical protein